MKKKFITTLSSVALAGLLTTSVITLSDVHHPTVAYAATTTNQKNALRKAKSYYKTMNMSKQGIYDQLTSEAGENFSEEDAQYAIDHLKVFPSFRALKKAKTYQKTMAMSTDAIYDQLTSEAGEKFTAEEAQYAIDNLDK